MPTLARRYMDGDSAHLHDLVDLHGILLAVIYLTPKEDAEPWLIEMLGDDFSHAAVLKGLCTAFFLTDFHGNEDLRLITRMTPEQAQDLLQPSPECGGDLRIVQSKLLGLLQSKGVLLEPRWLEERMKVTGGGLAPDEP